MSLIAVFKAFTFSFAMPDTAFDYKYIETDCTNIKKSITYGGQNYEEKTDSDTVITDADFYTYTYDSIC